MKKDSTLSYALSMYINGYTDAVIINGFFENTRKTIDFERAFLLIAYFRELEHVGDKKFKEVVPPPGGTRELFYRWFHSKKTQADFYAAKNRLAKAIEQPEISSSTPCPF